MKRILNAVLLALALPGAALAASAGADPFNFLFLDGGARPVAMGGAYTALARDANALLYNPAGLAEIKEDQAVFMHNQYFQDITQEYLSYASPQGWGASLNYLSFGSVRRTTVSNPAGTGLGGAELTGLALSGGYGVIVSNDMVAGAAVKFVRETVAGVTGQAPALDLGALYFPPRLEALTIGAAVQNIGAGVKFKSANEKLPLNLRLGAAYKTAVRGQPLLLALDLTKARGEALLAAFGLETVLLKDFPVRLGYSGRNDAGPGVTAGAGYARGDWTFDYAFVPFGELGSAHRLSAGYRWRAADRQKTKPAPKPAVAIVSKRDAIAEEFARLAADAKAQAARQAYGKAVTAYGQALLLKPGEPQVSLALAEIHMRDARYAEAEAVLADARLEDGDPRTAQVLERRGAALLRLERVPAAKKLFLRAIEFAEDNQAPGTARENAYYGLALCLERQEKFEDAVRNYRIALQLASTDTLKRLAQKRIGLLEVGRR